MTPEEPDLADEVAMLEHIDDFLELLRGQLRDGEPLDEIVFQIARMLVAFERLQERIEEALTDAHEKLGDALDKCLDRMQRETAA